MSRTEDITGNEKNIGGIGRNRGPRAGSDLSGGVTRVEGEKGLETPDRTGTNGRARPRSWFRQLGRVIGDPIELITSEVPVEVDPLVKLVARTIAGAGGDDPDRPTMRLTSERGGKVVSDRIEERLWHKSILVADRVVAAMKAQPVERIKDCKIDPPVGLVHGDTLVLKLNGIMGVAPDVIECLGQRYFHEERVEEVRGEMVSPFGEVLANLRRENEALGDRIDEATRAADEWKTRATEAQKAYLAAEAKVAELSKVRVFNVAGLVEKDLAERYESLRAAHDLMIANYQAVQAERDEARALIAESAPVVRFVQTLANGEIIGHHHDGLPLLLDGLTVEDIREDARGKFEAPADYDPRTYTDEQRQKVDDLLTVFWFDAYHRDLVGDTVDEVAAALGMRRAK